VLRNALLDLAYPPERLIPAPLQLVGDESVLRVRGIVLPLGP